MAPQAHHAMGNPKPLKFGPYFQQMHADESVTLHYRAMSELLILDNINALEDCLELTAPLATSVYTQADETLFPNGAYGTHLRHVVEFYRCFLDGLPSGKIDYSLRARDAKIEAHPDAGAEAIRDLITRLGRLDNLQQPLSFKSESDREEIWMDTTLARELEYLIHHAVHHFALMAIQLRHAGVAVPPAFGVARSTLRHLASCAP